MATKLFRLAATSPSLTNTTYFYKNSSAKTVVPAAGDLKIRKSLWFKGDGTSVGTSTFTTLSNGYYALCVNGVLQQSTLYTVNPASGLTLLSLGTAYSIAVSAPFTLSVGKVNGELVVP